MFTCTIPTPMKLKFTNFQPSFHHSIKISLYLYTIADIDLDCSCCRLDWHEWDIRANNGNKPRPRPPILVSMPNELMRKTPKAWITSFSERKNIKLNYRKKVFFFLTHLFDRDILLMKNFETKETKATQSSTFKNNIIKAL